ncbi:MAG: toll/interleukin-1 receptor domain-containing protein [Erysipelotrichales bacterium]|nr:toll/interleukin-1 receptor domain-containing protein [Erysipelotrichales bacterium]
MVNIFISYRRETGVDIAARVNNFFLSKGFNVFYDINSMQLGEFDKQIVQHINASQYFILILSKNALDRCCNENDWVRKEIECALNNNITIIPLFLPEFKFPNNLPVGLERIKFFHGIEYSAVLFDLIMEKMLQLINSTNDETEKKNTKRELIDILNNLHTITIDFRDSLRNGNQSKFNTALADITSHMQILYNYYEKTSYTEQQFSQIALNICNQYNKFVPYYNDFSNSRNRMSKFAQEVARLAEVEFGKFISLILETLKDLNRH